MNDMKAAFPNSELSAKGRAWHDQEPRARRDGQHADGGASFQPAAHRGAARLHGLLHASEHLRRPGTLNFDLRAGFIHEPITVVDWHCIHVVDF